MARGTYQDFNKVDVKVESVVAELVDNSIAREEVSRIDVVFRQDSDNIEIGRFLPHHRSPHTINSSNGFSMSVFNDGKGFEDVEHLHSSFELVKEPGKELDRGERESGLFHVGMKESTLNKFHHFSIIANIGTAQEIRSIIFPGHLNDFLYDWMPYPAAGSNPSNILPNHVDSGWIRTYMSDNNFVTCGHASGAREILCLEGVPNRNDIHFINDFADTIANFLGIIYSNDLIEERYELNVVTVVDEIEIIRKVKPIDLFWEQTTPDKISAMAANSDLTPQQKYWCKTISGYGTLKGHDKEIEIDYDGELTKFRMTPYLLPHQQIRDKLVEITPIWNGYKIINDAVSTINSGSIFLSESLQGCTFIRNGRTIVVGNHNAADNDGFYKLFDYGLSTDNTKTRIRIKIEYEKGSYTDRLFDLKPNKDGYKEIKSDVWKRIISALNSPIDGQSRGLFFPHDRSVPFYTSGDTNRHFKGKVDTKETWFKKSAIKLCITSGCKSYHAKNAKCPKRPCASCNNSLYDSDCTASTCGHRCENEECGQIGHTSENCTINDCGRCNLNPTNCICCGICEQPVNDGKCGCPCPVCSENYDSDGECGCDNSPPPPPPPRPRPGHEDDVHGTPHYVTYYPNNKQHSIDAVRGIMESSGITLEDLR